MYMELLLFDRHIGRHLEYFGMLKGDKMSPGVFVYGMTPFINISKEKNYRPPTEGSPLSLPD